MEIEDLTMEQAKEIFFSAKGQESWKMMTRLVGSPVEYSFQNDYVARLLLCGTLGSMLVRRDKKLALDGLTSLEKLCVTTYDWAVWMLTKGTYYELFEDRGRAVDCYEKAIENYAGTYIAYFRMAKDACEAGTFDVAEKYCLQGMSWLKQDELYEQDILEKIEMQFMDFLDEILKRAAAKKNAAEKNVGKDETQRSSLADIWAIEDETEFIIALDEHISQKCQYGDDMASLSTPERVFYITQSLEREVNNGGFDQFFFNSCGDFANELVYGFTEIGALKTAQICKKAVSIFGDEVPSDRDERDDVISDNEEFAEILRECDDAFFEYAENLNALNYEYVMKNKAFFT